MVVLPEFGIGKTVRNAGLGPAAEVERKGLSQHFAEQLETIEEVAALETPTIEVDPGLDQQHLEEVGELLDGILPVRLTGQCRQRGHLCVTPPALDSAGYEIPMRLCVCGGDGEDETWYGVVDRVVCCDGLEA
jgi:hypothetical protein